MRGIAAKPRPWLAPVGALFGAAAAVRAGLYRRRWLPTHRLGRPVISVGNLAVGGRGKSPVVARVAELLRDAGRSVAVLSRGYGGSFDGDVLVVSDGRKVLADARRAGDEPVMLARQLPGVVVAVGRRRHRVGAEVEARFGVEVHVLDDGFQHLSLHRDLDLLCLRAADLSDRPLPAGLLREFPSAYRRAQALLLLDGAGAVPPGLPVFALHRRGLGFSAVDGGPAAAPPRALLVSGIASPDAFEADVAAAGVEVAGHLRFPDHHTFTPDEARRAEAQARAAGTDTLVTTAKDAVRWPAGAIAAPVLAYRTAAVIDDEVVFRELLLSVTAREAA